MKIEIINVASQSKPAKNGTYTQLDIAYKNLDFQGKIEAKKVMSFTHKDTFAVLSKATLGQVYEIERVKEGEYWQWTSAKLVGNDAPTTNSSNISKPNATPKSTYETPEERALRQRMIVRQSSLSNAIDTLAVNPGKDKLDTDQVLALAKVYFDWVMNPTDNKLMSDTVAPDFSDMDSDIPL